VCNAIDQITRRLCDIAQHQSAPWRRTVRDAMWSGEADWCQLAAGVDWRARLQELHQSDVLVEKSDVPIEAERSLVSGPSCQGENSILLFTRPLLTGLR
jgi:hypothetical protein